MGYVIRTEGLSRAYGAVKAVDGLTMQVPEGVVFGFLGPNGAGKTTTIRLLLGLTEPTSGTAEVLGSNVARNAAAVRERCGTLLEHSGLYERLSVRDNLEFEGRIRGFPPGERKMRIDELLERFELSDRQNEQAGRLSRGMKQKLAVARAVLSRPSLVFLDEPTTGLDVPTAGKLREDIARLAADGGATVFLTTHNLSEAELLCGSIGVIRNGSLLFSGSPAELRLRTGSNQISIETSPAGRQLPEAELAAGLRERFPFLKAVRIRGTRIILDTEPGTRAAPLIGWLVERGIPVEEVVKGTPTLEKAFLELLTGDSGEKTE